MVIGRLVPRARQRRERVGAVATPVAVQTSVQTVLMNPRTMFFWALIIAAALMVGSAPLLVGLAVAMPVLGHASWHLYRKMIAPEAAAAEIREPVF